MFLSYVDYKKIVIWHPLWHNLEMWKLLIILAAVKEKMTFNLKRRFFNLSVDTRYSIV